VQWDEAEAVARVQRDPESAAAHQAFAEIVEELQGPIYAQIRRSQRDLGRAQDLLQETFLRVFRSLPTYDGRAPLRAWVGRIARNLCIDESRRTRPGQDLRTESGTGIVERRAGEVPTAERLLSKVEEREQVRAALGELPPLYREIVHLRVYEGLPYAEIALLLDCSVGAAKQRMHKAIRLLEVEFRKVADP